MGLDKVKEKERERRNRPNWTAIYLGKERLTFLRDLAAKEKVSLAALVRKAIDHYFRF